MGKPVDPKSNSAKPGCGAKKTPKGVTYYVSAT
jgi:hypothetical protein